MWLMMTSYKLLPLFSIQLLLILHNMHHYIENIFLLECGEIQEIFLHLRTSYME